MRLIRPLAFRVTDRVERFVRPFLRKFWKLEFYWHVHHRVLVEPINPAEGVAKRRRYIREWKPLSEIGIRLRAMKKARNIPPPVVKAAQAWLDAKRAWGDLEDRDPMVWRDDPDVYNAVLNAFVDAEDELDEQLQLAQPGLEDLHREQCDPDCPWNGDTLFPLNDPDD